MKLYLDCDTTPAKGSQYVRGSLAVAQHAAYALLADVTEGQIGIYENHIGAGFKGYAIKYPNERPYFEAAESAAA